MKIFKRLPVICAVAAIGLFGCGEEEVADLKRTEVETPKAALKYAAWGVCCTWNGVDDCPSPKTNCFEDIIVSSRAHQVELDDAADTGKDAVADFFSTNGNWHHLFPDLDADSIETGTPNIVYLEKLRSGNYGIQKVNNFNRTFYLVGTDEDFQNGSPEFVLVLRN